ncbi:asparagine synthase-related protein [Hwanghaeella sp.]|uniref:asparagine synthase-related protein n=1 Tax=Hwanghaeella sp. TaxID=2605943 RepID=UPI003CCC415F
MTAAIHPLEPRGTVSADIRLPDIALWRRFDIEHAEVWCAGTADRDLGRKIVAALDTENPGESVAAALRDLPTQFAIIVRSGPRLVCAVDRIRSIPLIWSKAPNGAIVIAQQGDALFDGLAAQGAPRPTVDMRQAKAVAMSGYTIGPATLYHGVAGLLAGEFLMVHDGQEPVTLPYFRYLPWRTVPASPVAEAESSEALGEILLNALKDTVRKADGRCIAVPLSAGLDSRYVVSGLKELGYENVLCFSYGQDGNREAQAARKIAQELGYPWVFQPYELGAMQSAFRGAGYKAFVDYSDSLTAVHFPQDFIAISELLARGDLPPDAMVVNGQSGDYLTGNHIPASLADLSTGDTADIRQVVSALLSKHFALWGQLQVPAQQAIVENLLKEEFDLLTSGAPPMKAGDLFGLFEASEYVDRQSKYVVNGQRSYEKLGLDWDLPLWHGDLIDFYAAQPLTAKRGQKLYRDTLMRMNWQGVWRDIPVNATRLRPWWLPPVRNAMKLLHAPLGRDAWHRFERRYLGYFMSTLCAYAVRRWSEVARDTRNPRSAMAYHVEDYLLRHGVTMTDVEEAGR